MLAHVYLIFSLQAFLVVAWPTQEAFVSSGKPYDVQVRIFLAPANPFNKTQLNRPTGVEGVIRSKVLYRALHGMLASAIICI